jgi:putative hydrolase of the HAD superfamily
MYDVTLAALGLAPSDVVFIGDSWGPDVVGPTSAGMTALHLWRDGDRSDEEAPDLTAGVRRIGDLRQVLDVFGIN